MTPSAEQLARNMLERMGIEDAQSFTAGQLVELANLIAERARPQGPTVVMEPQEAARAGAPMDFANPQWGQGSAVHNWQNHVSEEVQSLWMGFSQAQRAALARQAQALADNEEWD